MVFSFRIGGRIHLIIAHLLYILINYSTLAQDPADPNIITNSPEVTDPNPIEISVSPVSNIISTTVGPTGADNGSSDEGITEPNQVAAGPEKEMNTFLAPQTISDDVDLFTYKSKEYLFVNMQLMYDLAEIMCTRYSGILASIPNYKLASFLAIALSETNLEFESLWVGGKKDAGENGTWNWIKNNHSEVIGTDIIEAIANKDADAVVTFDRNCLAFAREHHEKPQFKQLDCNVERAFMCERAQTATGENNSTHQGWLEIGNRLYKIFREKVDYDTATSNCFRVSPNATLAVVDKKDVVQQLGRYLLIGRPSLENAWIGARWKNDKYEFEADASILLKNITNVSSEFPPWRNNTMQNAGGCLLLDRHLSDKPLFVEAACQRLRSYICSRPSFNTSAQQNFTITTFKDRIYHAYFSMQYWETARSICIVDKGKLAEPDAPEKMEELLFVMGQNASTFQHVWVGGKFVSDKWVWDNRDGPIDQATLPFIKNDTYIEKIEQSNTCLNLDRENHIVGFFYGTNCYYPQHFICELSSTPVINDLTTPSTIDTTPSTIDIVSSTTDIAPQ